VRKKAKGIERFDTSVFNGEYVTGDVSQDYLQHIENLRKDSARGDTTEKDNEVVEIYNTA
jgi:amidophosphoribosyltransferase